MPYIGLTIPGPGPGAPPASVLEFARRAEAAGVHSVWATERVMYDRMDAPVLLGALAACTSRVQIGTAVLLGVLRQPLLVAKLAATVDQLSGGRLVLGLGVGGRRPDFLASGVPIEQRGARMEDLVELLELAWSGQPIRYQGRHHSYDLGPLGPLPLQRPRPPIWFGGTADAVLRRVARLGDGYIGTTGAGVAGFRANWARIREYAEAAGRDPASITPAALVHYRMDDDPEVARQAMRDYLTQSYDARRAALTLGNMVGTPDDVVRGALEYFEAGVEVLIVSSIAPGLDHLDRFCQQVLPRLAREGGLTLAG